MRFVLYGWNQWIIVLVSQSGHMFIGYSSLIFYSYITCHTYVLYVTHYEECIFVILVTALTSVSYTTHWWSEQSLGTIFPLKVPMYFDSYFSLICSLSCMNALWKFAKQVTSYSHFCIHFSVWKLWFIKIMSKKLTSSVKIILRYIMSLLDHVSICFDTALVFWCTSMGL